MPEYITSRQNPSVRLAASLSDRKERESQGRFAFEGEKLFHEAVSSKAPLLEVYAVGELAGMAEREAPPSCRVFSVTEQVYDRLSMDKSPDGIFCVCGRLDDLHTFGGYPPRGGIASGSKLACVSVRDPGNIGTIIRSARAFGIGELILSSDCADIYNPKTVRAAMGALFSVRIHVSDDIISALASLSDAGYDTCAAVLREGAARLGSAPRVENRVYVVGNEGHGLPDDVIDACKSTVFIPMEPGSESLNAAMAATVLMWDGYAGQR